MNRVELEVYAEVLRRSGITFARSVVDGSGNLVRLEDVPWEQAIPIVMQRTGWRVRVEASEPTPVTPLRLEP